VQREVAARLVATPGSKAYGALTLACRYRAEARPLLAIPRAAFHPVPGVDSMLVRFDLLDAPRIRVASEHRLFEVIRASFSQRRKTLRNTLKGLVTAAELDALGIDPGRRAQELSVAEFARLAAALALPEKSA